MTVKEIRAILAENAASLRETDRIVQETSRQIQETKQIMKENAEKTDRQIQETYKQMRETDRKMDKLSEQTDRKIAEVSKQIKSVSKQIGGIDNNIGYHAEQFFQNVFADKKVFGGIKYDNIILNMKHSEDVEFDIVLKNGNSVAIIEVKNRIRANFVKKLAEERIKEFRKYFPEYKGYYVYLGIAGFSFNKDVLESAKKYGVGIIRQAGDGIEVAATGLRAYR